MEVKVDELAAAVAEELGVFADMIDKKVLNEAIEETTKKTVEFLKAKSPRGTRKKKYYAKSWASRKNALGHAKDKNTRVIYNRGNSGLTHLLEYGHAKVNGGRTEAQPHIKPAEDYAYDMLHEKTVELLKKYL